MNYRLYTNQTKSIIGINFLEHLFKDTIFLTNP